MSRILVLYGTTDGHTAKIAGAIGNALWDAGCVPTVVDARRRHFVVASDFDGVIIAASVHAGGYQKPVRRWVRDNIDALGRVPTAFVSVCLGVLERKAAVDRELWAIVRRFLTPLGWQPDEVKMVAGALRYTRYGWLKKIVMRRIAAKTGGGTDTSRDYDYTDWDDVVAFVREFVQDHALVPGLQSAGAFTP